MDTKPENSPITSFMNEAEQKAAKSLLGKLESATPDVAPHIAAAYQALTQGALNRINGEKSAR